MQCFFFVCPELIEELEGARNMKFDPQVINNESTKKVSKFIYPPNPC